MDYSKKSPVLLTIGGSDPSAGAGGQLDLRVGEALSAYVTQVITTVTVQNTVSFDDLKVLPAEIVRGQLATVCDDFNIGAIKVGMLGSEENARAIASFLGEYVTRRAVPIVVDPVLSSSTGRAIFPEHATSVYTKLFLPLATVVTPNLPELERLMRASGKGLPSGNQLLENKVTGLMELSGIRAILVKGGHEQGEFIEDRLFTKSVESSEMVARTFSHPRIGNTEIHGTGCFVSTYIATRLMQGYELSRAVDESIRAVQLAIERSYQLGSGMRLLNVKSICDQTGS